MIVLDALAMGLIPLLLALAFARRQRRHPMYPRYRAPGS